MDGPTHHGLDLSIELLSYNACEAAWQNHLRDQNVATAELSTGIRNGMTPLFMPKTRWSTPPVGE